MSFALARAADLGEVVAIDYWPVFVEEAIRRNTDSRERAALYTCTNEGYN